MSHLRKQTWQERCREVDEYHKDRIRENPRQTIRDTAAELNRSYGSINADLQLASWLKSHPRIEKLHTAREAVLFIKSKKVEMRNRA